MLLSMWHFNNLFMRCYFLKTFDFIIFFNCLDWYIYIYIYIWVLVNEFWGTYLGQCWCHEIFVCILNPTIVLQITLPLSNNLTTSRFMHSSFFVLELFLKLNLKIVIQMETANFTRVIFWLTFWFLTLA